MVPTINEDELIEHMKGCILRGKPLSRSYIRSNQRVNPPVSSADIEQAEALVGFPLPTIIKRLYVEVGNGGFGPGYGLLPLNNEEDPQALETDSLVTTYLALHPSTQRQTEERSGFPALPEKLIMICDWGCNISSWIDCSQRELPVLRSEATLDCNEFTLEASSFASWLEHWLKECGEEMR